MKKLVIIAMAAWLISSCAIAPTASRFSKESNYIGANKEDILKKYGQPFMCKSYIEEGKSVEVLYYKEPVRVANCPYVVTTALYFENSILQKFIQTDKFIKEFDVAIDSIN